MPNLLRSFTGKIIPGRRKRPSPLQVNDTNVSHPTTTDPKLERGPHLVSVSPCDPGGAGNYLSTNHPTFDATLRYTSGPSQGLEDNLIQELMMMEPVRKLSPEELRRKPSITSIAQVAYDNRARRVAAKEEAERRVRTCEQHLEVLRHELSDAERDLQEVENTVRDWEEYFAKRGTKQGSTSDAPDHDYDISILSGSDITNP